VNEYRYGPIIFEDGVEFRLWAPLEDSVFLKLKDAEPLPMMRDEERWHRCRASAAGPGSLYSFVLTDGSEVPDPGSRHQPEDAHGPSEVVDLTHYKWEAVNWIGRPWEEAVIYELHVGAFTPEGTFRSIMDKLDHLARLGITAIQIMPISDFPGRYNWGYDGVLPYAPGSSYGRLEDFMALVDAAHDRGLSMFLDVVYNHFGPDGNYLLKYAPVFTDRHKNLGATASITTATNREQFASTLSRMRSIGSKSSGSKVSVLSRMKTMTSDLLKRDEDGNVVHFTAQWNDDVHHVLHIAATDETFGYYQDYADDLGTMGRALAEGFVFQGEHMPCRGESRGKPTGNLPPTAFISFIQNHDQIGNRAHGDRMITYRPLEPLKAVTAVYLLSPQIPMLFMGEEWGVREDFHYFCDFDEDLNEKVRAGRREELARLPGFDSDDLLDPTAKSMFEAAKLNWLKLSEPDASEMLAFYRSLLALRHQRIVPLVKDAGGGAGRFRQGGKVTGVEWTLKNGEKLNLLANLSVETGSVADLPVDEVIFTLGSATCETLGPRAVVFSIASGAS